MNLKNIIKVLCLSLIININLYGDSINDAIYQHELGYQEKAIKNLSNILNSSNTSKRAYNILELLYKLDNSIFELKYIDNTYKKKKIQNKVISLYQKYCNDGDMEVCASLGLLYYKNNLIIEDKELSKKERLNMSKKLFTKACDNGNNKGCYGLTNFDFYPSPAYKNIERRKLLKNTCANGYMPACTTYGISCEIGQGKEIAKEAKIWYKKSCDNDNTRGCFLLGGFYDSLYFQTKNKTDKKIALKSYSQACQNRNTPIEDACRKYVSLSEYGNY